MKKLLVSIILGLLMLISCKSEPEGYFHSSNLPGMIYDDDNRPCDKVLLTIWYLIEDREEEIIQVQSDINGRFTIPGLERGNYRIIAEKDGYEKIETKIFYSSRLDVLYLKILSQKQILNNAAYSLEEKRFGIVDGLLIRAGEINENDPYYLYVKSVFLYEKNNYPEAVKQLEHIISLGYKFPYVHLLLADLYQYELDEPQKALNQLKIFVNLFGDSEVDLRIKELEKNEF